MSEGKLIYSKRFPKNERTGLCMKTGEDAMKGPPSLTTLLRGQNIIRSIKKNSVYLFRADKMEECQRFIDLAKEFSQDYKISTEIEKYDFYVSVTLDFPCGVYVGECKRRLSELMNLCDRIALFPSPDEPFLLSFTLDYYTHDCYISGNKAE